MEREEFRSKLHRVSFTASMNQRYHQYQADHFARIDQWCTIATGILAVFGFMSAFATTWPAWLGQALTGATAVLAVSLSATPFAEWNQKHLDIFRRWSDLLEDVESAFVCIPETIEDHHLQQLVALTRKLHRINAIEPSPNDKLLEKCDALERRSRAPASDAKNLTVN